MRYVCLFIAVLLFAGAASTTVENLQQALADAAEEQQAQILTQLYDDFAKTDPEAAYAYAIEAEKLALKL